MQGVGAGVAAGIGVRLASLGILPERGRETAQNLCENSWHLFLATSYEVGQKKP